MRAALQYFFTAHRLPLQSLLFKRVLYLLVLLKCGYWLWHYDVLFGENSIIYRAQGHTNFIKDLAYILYNNKSEMLPLYFIIASVSICLLMLLRRRNNVTADLALWLLVENLHYSCYATLTGGDYLLNQFLFFNAFIVADTASDRGKYRDLYLCLHNAAICAVVIQVCIVYMAAGLAKLNDEAWLDGSAASVINRISHFSLGTGNTNSWDGFHRAATYMVFAYQLAFPLLIWVRPLKVPLLVLGALMHVYIAIIAGLVVFSAVMLAGYIYFWPPPRTAPTI